MGLDTQHTCTEGRPSRCTPPGDDKAQESAKSRATSFGSPQVDRSGGWGSRTNLSDNSSSNEGEHHGYKVTSPIGQVSTGGNTSAESNANTTDKVKRSSRKSQYEHAPKMVNSEKLTECGREILEQGVCPMKDLVGDLVADHISS